MFNFFQFVLTEAITIDTPDLLQAVKHKKVNLADIFHLEDITPMTLLTELYTNSSFEAALHRQKLEKSPLETSTTFESFLKNTLDLNFFFLYPQGKLNIEQPRYLVLQKKRDTQQWAPIQAYKIMSDIQPFYETLHTKTIELRHKAAIYIYKTTNGGNDWLLQNVDTQTKLFKKDLTKKQLQKLLNDKGQVIKMTIIP